MLATLHLSNFRGYEEERVCLGANLTVLTGGNAQGKSSLLRAVQVLGLGESRASSGEHVRFGAAGGAVEGLVSNGSQEDRLHVSLAGNGRGRGLRLALNGKAVARPRWVGRLPVLFVGPDEREQVMGPPSARRVLLDELLDQGEPAYLTARREFERALRQRNRALADPALAPEAAEIWEEPLVRAGSVLAACRVRILEALGPRVAAWHGEFSGEASKNLRIEYVSGSDHALPPRPDSAEAWERVLRGRFAAVREHERNAGTTLIGPHRDEIAIRIAGHQLKATGSAGEVWTAILALGLASAEYLGVKLGRLPVLLLDDVLAALDEERRERVLAMLAQYDSQVLLTTTRHTAGPFARQAFVVMRHKLMPLGAGIGNLAGGTCEDRVFSSPS